MDGQPHRGRQIVSLKQVVSCRDQTQIDQPDLRREFDPSHLCEQIDVGARYLPAAISGVGSGEADNGQRANMSKPVRRPSGPGVFFALYGGLGGLLADGSVVSP
jgi:hypothetical protein